MTGTATMSSDTRKRLGQFFTCEPLARLLAALAQGQSASSVIDPMGGSGDMVAAALSQNPDATAAAIEIEPAAAQTAADRLGAEVSVVHGSAFDPASWRELRSGWELVITNPPYVRYQTGSSDGDEDFDIPSAARIRAGLIELLAANANLDLVEREAFLYCARSYSGLADLAVPSWLLCASQVAEGGRLAVLVPNTWLSRDYASPVLYILRRFFDIEYVVEDTDMTWFADALVRTTLVVARRTADKGTAFAPNTHLRVALPASLANESSVVGAALPDSDSPEQDFAATAHALLVSGSEGSVAGAAATLSDESDLIEVLRNAGRRQPWPCSVKVDHDDAGSVPERLRRALSEPIDGLVALEKLGWKVGQGLRSGANDFFYVTKTNDGFVSPILPGDTLDLPEEAVRPAIRRQADLPNERHLGAVDATQSYVLVLDDWALPEDIEGAAGPKSWKPMTGDLARLTRAAAAYTYDRGRTTVAIPELSAVRTNVRAGSPERGTPARFWYQLPPLAPRHVPKLYIARVNGGHPLTYANAGGLVIDANFSTLWPVADDALSEACLLAMLRSVWSEAFLEVVGTVLGGGALKVEASHLRRLMLPDPGPDEAEALRSLGGHLILGIPTEQGVIDHAVVEMLGTADKSAAADRLRSLASDLHISRATKAKKA